MKVPLAPNHSPVLSGSTPSNIWQKWFNTVQQQFSFLYSNKGVATLSGGTITVSNPNITASSVVMLTVQSLGTVAVPSSVGVTAIVPGTSFTITSSDATDTSDIGYFF